MNKILVTGIAAIVAAASLAIAQSVPSKNAVGYVKVNCVANGLSFVGLSFKSMAGGDGLDEVIGDQLTGGLNSGDSDRIIVWDPIAVQYKSFWKVEGAGDPTFDDKWFIDDGAFPPTAADATLIPGNGFWVQSRQGAVQELTLLGEVPAEMVWTNGIVNGIQQVTFPFSADIGVNNPTNGLAAAATGGLNSGDSDRLIFWDAGTEQYISLWLVAGAGDPTYDGKWFYDDGAFPPNLATDNLEIGNGFWFQRRDLADVEWKPLKPYTYP